MPFAGISTRPVSQIARSVPLINLDTLGNSLLPILVFAFSISQIFSVVRSCGLGSAVCLSPCCGHFRLGLKNKLS